ncbi:IS630 family transposase [Streptomyces sp. NPDC051644]|uniref:IS630 family transposase n=1 Tax=Streptomyces sp. NPDC051644 TaxID=3365666 RepID=UPI0037877EA2
MIITLVGAGEGVAGMVEAVVVELDERVRERLIRTAVSLKAQVRAVLRARIVLAAAEGLSNGAIARDLAVSVNTVRKWRGRFAALGRDGLKDAARSGRPKAYGPQVTVAIVAAATSASPYPEATWSHRTIATQVAGTVFATISASQVGRILADLDLKPHRVRGWLTRRDTPDFWDRVADVCDLYRDPPAGAVVLSIDEKTAIAARARRHPGRPAGPGKAYVEFGGGVHTGRYLYGHSLELVFDQDTVEIGHYNHDNGQGLAEQVIARLRESGEGGSSG